MADDDDDRPVIPAEVFDLVEERKKRKKRREANPFDDWRDKCILNENDSIKVCHFNYIVALEHHEKLKDRIWLDTFTNQILCRDLPWEPHRRRGSTEVRPWIDEDTSELASMLQHEGANANTKALFEAITAVAERKARDSLQDWLGKLQWDGTPRVATWLFDYFTTLNPDDHQSLGEYLEAVGQRWMIGAIARAMRPGCKNDQVLILEGRQGIKKSSALATLCPFPEWFTDHVGVLGTRESAMDISGKWIVEIAELSAMKRSDIERTKAFLSRQIDSYRAPYARINRDHPRRCVFAGSTNSDSYLGDMTGNRRFLPVYISSIDIDALARDRDQLWAEALHLFRNEQIWWLMPNEVVMATTEQEKRMEDDPWEETVLRFAESRTSDVDVNIPDILVQSQIKMSLDKIDTLSRNRVSRILIGNGYIRKQRRRDGRRIWCYLKQMSLEDD